MSKLIEFTCYFETSKDVSKYTVLKSWKDVFKKKITSFLGNLM